MFSLKNVKKPLVLLCFRSKMLKNHWFYFVFAQTCWKSIGFTVFSLKNVEKALVLLCCRSKKLKKQWFYCVFAQKNEKTHWCYKQRTRNKLKNHWFYCKTSPSNRQQPSNQQRATDPGSGFAPLDWICYEEPIQTSCLGKTCKRLIFWAGYRIIDLKDWP